MFFTALSKVKLQPKILEYILEITYPIKYIYLACINQDICFSHAKKDGSKISWSYSFKYVSQSPLRMRTPHSLRTGKEWTGKKEIEREREKTSPTMQLVLLLTGLGVVLGFPDRQAVHH